MCRLACICAAADLPCTDATHVWVPQADQQHFRSSGVRLALHKLMHVQVPNVVGFIEEGKKVAKKQMDITLHGLWGKGVQTPLQAGISSLSLVCMLSHKVAGQKACRVWGAPSKDG